MKRPPPHADAHPDTGPSLRRHRLWSSSRRSHLPHPHLRRLRPRHRHQYRTKPTVTTAGNYQASCTAGDLAFTQTAAAGDTVALAPDFAYTYQVAKSDTGWTVSVFRCGP